MNFNLGQVVITPNAQNSISPLIILACLAKHKSGQWGDLTKHDKAANEFAVANGERILSSYNTPNGKLWIITEADRSSTCILRPEDY